MALVGASLVLTGVCLPAQPPGEEAAPPEAAIASLQLSPEAAKELQKAMSDHNYLTAERLLLAEIDRDGHSPRAARLLSYAGTVYFRNQDYVNAAIAWKKAEAIAPLSDNLRFSLAMAYIRMGHSDWARPVLEGLAARNERGALYPYWLGRLAYDGHEYEMAIREFKKAIELDPQMARAYDNLGLVYYYENQNELAVANYEKAIELDRAAGHLSPWPFLNLAITQQFLDRQADAERNLREALRLDPKFAKAHFQLGTVLEDSGRPEEALAELEEAANLNATYAEPHMAMARILHRLGQEAEAKKEVETYRRLHEQPTPKQP